MTARLDRARLEALAHPAGPCEADPVARLRRVQDRLRDTGDPDDYWLVEVLELALEGASFRAALGLHPRWREAQDHAARNVALIAIAKHFPGMSGRGTAAAIANAIDRYRASGWPRDRREGRRPAAELPALCYDFLAANDGEGLSATRIRTILSGSCCDG
jgi:hypothetical protein